MATLQELQGQHPEWNVIQVVDAPGGGQWAVGADGGVFALGGAPYMGGYTDLPAADKQGDRQIVGIKVSGSGYTLLSDQPGQEYLFDPARVAATGVGSMASSTGAPGATTGAPVVDAAVSPRDTPEGQSAKGLLYQLMEEMGLPTSLADSLWNSSITKSAPEIAADVRKSPEYKQRYPGMDALRASGRAISEGEYRSTENQIKGLMSYYGLPEGFYDQPGDFAKLIGAEVSPRELEGRIQMAASAAFTAPPELRQELERFGVTTGDLTAYFLDPPTAEAAITRRYTFEQASIGVKSRQVGFGLLTQDEAERLRLTGMSAEQAGGALSQAGQFKGFTTGTLESEGVTQGDLVGVAADDIGAQERLTREQEKRRARFEGGGGASSGGRGGTGLGSS